MSNITIDGDQYTIPDAEAKGFVEGHVCTVAEAKTLFQTFKENVGNNMRKAVKAAKEAGKDAQALVTEYAQAYSFAMPSSGGARRVVDPVEREARAMARKAIQGALVAEGKGRKLKDVADLESKIDQIIEKNDLLTKAKKIVRARQSAGAEVLDGIDLAA